MTDADNSDSAPSAPWTRSLSPHGDLVVDLTAGGHSGAYGRAFLWAPAHNLGRGFEDQERVYEVAKRLLQDIEMRTGRRCVLGELRIKWDEAPQEEMTLDDRRVEPPIDTRDTRKKGTKAQRQGKRHGQQYSIPGGYDE